MYVLLYAGVLFGLVYFDLLHKTESIITSWLTFGGLYLAFVVLRFIILKVTMPAPPPMPVVPTENAGGTALGFIADILLGTGGLGTAFGQGWDEAANEAKLQSYKTSLQQWASNYQNEVVSPRVGVAVLGALVAVFVTIGCAYYIGM